MQLVGTTSNRSAIGARVRVVAGDLTLVDEVRGGGSYLSQNDLRVHFGLGGYDGAVRVEVRWPNGNEEQWDGIAANRICCPATSLRARVESSTRAVGPGTTRKSTESITGRVPGTIAVTLNGILPIVLPTTKPVESIEPSPDPPRIVK